MHMDNEFAVTEKYLDMLKNTESEIFVFGTRDSSYIAISFLWSQGITPTAFITNSENEHGNLRFGIPILSPQEALKNQISPIVFICSYSQKVSEKLRGQVGRSPVKNPVFISVHELERLYIRAKRAPDTLSGVKPILGTTDLPSDVISTYTVSVERDYETALQDIKYISAHVRAIKTLAIRTPSSLIDTEFVAFMQKVHNISNIMYINIKTDPYRIFSSELLDKLKRYAFKFDFWNFSTETQSGEAPHFENLTGRILYSYTEKECYQPQPLGHDVQPLTIKRLKEIIAEDIGMEIPVNASDADQEICFSSICSGLSDQILYYFSACLVSENTSKTVIIDDTFNYVFSKKFSVELWTEALYLIYNSVRNTSRESIEKAVGKEDSLSTFCYNRLELYEIFSCKFQLFSELFPKPVWERLVTKLRQTITITPLLGYLSRLNCKMSFYHDGICDQTLINASNCIGIADWMEKYLKDPSNRKSNFLLSGSITNSFYSRMAPPQLACWNLQNCKWARARLKFPPIEDARNRQLAEQITHSDSVVIHVRRGDYLYLNPSLISESGAYFRAAISAVKNLKEYKNRKYFIFSDEIQWCQEHGKELGLDLITDELIFVDNNRGKDSFRDLQLLSMGKLMILSAGSSFSAVALILNEAIEKYVCYADYEELKAAGASEEELLQRLVKDLDR